MTNPWTTNAVTEITGEPARIAVLFPAAGRAVGRDPVDPAADPLGLRHGTADDAAREQLVRALLAALPDDAAATALGDLYRYGDDAERRGVLRGLNAAPELPSAVIDAGLGLVADALRANDPRLVAAALGDFAGAHLDDHAWRHGVLKALFMGIPVDVVARLDDRRRITGRLGRGVQPPQDPASFGVVTVTVEVAERGRRGVVGHRGVVGQGGEQRGDELFPRLVIGGAVPQPERIGSRVDRVASDRAPGGGEQHGDPRRFAGDLGDGVGRPGVGHRSSQAVRSARMLRAAAPGASCEWRGSSTAATPR